MCGIAGLMMKTGEPADAAVLDRLVGAIAHRGPDAEGRFVHGPVGLVMTRLSIVDVEGGDQPLLAPDGTALVCNGEIYNAPELRAGLPDYPFRTRSDCEPILPLLARRGLDFAEALRGMYALAAYEPGTGRLVLARDSFGIKPLYIVETERCIAFASELQALLRAGLVPAAIAPEARAELLQLKYTTGRTTLVPRVQRVLPGETLVLQDGAIRDRRQIPVVPYDALEAAGRRGPRTGRAELLRRFDRVMTEAVEVHLRMDTPWRLYLSGGIDSSILLVLAQRILGGGIEALTIGYAGAAGEDESADAMRMADRAGAACTRVEMSEEDFWALSPRIVAAVDDPTADAAVLPTWMLGRATFEAGAKVALTGEGADEIFGGYSRYRKASLPLIFRRRRRRRGVFTNTGIDLGRFGGWEAGMDEAEHREGESLSTRAQVLQAVDVKERLPDSLLVKLDRCLMANGIEGRTPFLDREVLRFAVGLPDELKATLRFGKVLLREWLAEANPDARPYARKRGFNVPVGAWMQARREALQPLLARQPGIAALFTAEDIARILGTARGDSQPGWSLLSYALWHSHHILGVPVEGDIGAVLGAAAEMATPREAMVYA